MSHWFHRNPLKCTTTESFGLSLVSVQPQAIQLCDRLKNVRRQLLELMVDPSSDPQVVDKLLAQYLSLLMGFVFNNGLDPNYGPNDSSKLRHYIKFKWTDSLGGQIPCVKQDSMFELISICYEFAIWLSKHSSHLSAKSDISMDSAKECHKCLRKAAGVITVIQTQWVDRLLDKNFSPGSDLDPRVMSAYIQQCQAEAQEVTIGRAIELKHSPTLVSALANETSKLFLSAAGALKALDQTKFGKWMSYFQMKSAFYESYAFCYLGESLLEQEKCGEAIRALEESEKFYSTSVKLCKEYRKMKSPLGGTGAKIDEHLFFRQLQPSVKRTKDKCIRENGFIFHQTVPKDCPLLELKATHGLVAPEEFSLPSVSELWTAQSYSAFDLSKNITFIDPRAKPTTSEPKEEQPIPVTNEKPIKYSESDPKTQSGCQIQ